MSRLLRSLFYTVCLLVLATPAWAGPYLGDFAPGETVYCWWNTNGSNGASITRSTNGTVSVYKDNNTTQTTTGVTDTEDIDTLTGVHQAVIATTDSFYGSGPTEFAIVLSAATIDTQTVNASLCQFSIGRRKDNQYTIHRLALKKGTTSYVASFNVADQRTGGPLTGLSCSAPSTCTSGLTAYYSRGDQGNANGTAITLDTATRGSFTSGGLVAKDATNLPGEYELGIPNAVIATGASRAQVTLKGASNMKPVVIMIELVDNVAADLVAGNVLTAGGTYRRNIPSQTYPLYMVDSSGDPKTGLTVAVKVSKDGAAGVAIGGSVAQIDATNLPGWYLISLDDGDTDCSTCAFFATAAGAEPRAFYFTTAP